MPRYRLRTLLILLAIGPPLVAGVWTQYRSFQMRREFNELLMRVGAKSRRMRIGVGYAKSAR